MTSEYKNITGASYDVVVIGAGPAGGQCARELAGRGFAVLLAEQVRNFEQNNFSSGGSTLELLSEFGLPDHIIGAHWNRLRIVGPTAAHTWCADKPLGVVLDFAAFRKFLADDARALGADVRMHHSYESHRRDGSELIVTLKCHAAGDLLNVRARLLIDATGYRRRVMTNTAKKTPLYQKAVGVEYLVQTDPLYYRSGELIFFLGRAWMPNGYGWIFPMDRFRQKVGAAYIGERPSGTLPLKAYAQNILDREWPDRVPRIIDIHGGSAVYTRKMDDVHYADGVMAVGDAVSAINPLGLEGIRHGMRVARFAADGAAEALKSGREKPLKDYERRTRQYYGSRWKQSLFFADIAYGKLSDARMDDLLRIARGLSMDQVMQILFEFKFGAAMKAALGL